MLKLTFCLHRLPHLSREEFQRYWLETHGPLSRERDPALGVKRYVQVHTLDSPMNEVLRKSRGGGEPYDGVAELWWDSVEEFAAAAGTPEGRQAGQELLSDERKFIDLRRCALWVGEEHEIVGG